MDTLQAKVTWVRGPWGSTMNPCRLASLIVCLVGLPTGCVAPGSSIGHVFIRGSLQVESGERLSDRDVQLILPAARNAAWPFGVATEGILVPVLIATARASNCSRVSAPDS
jgi:hypothetical protein